MMDDTLRDVLLVSRFEILRAVRTWRALAICTMYLAATCGVAWLFIKFIGGLEDTLATELGVPTTRIPGTLTQELVKTDSFRSTITHMTGSDDVATLVERVPLLAVFHQWFGVCALPFLAAAISAESISADAASRTLRYELLRTGRLELVLGRFLGQLALTALACVLAAVGVWVVGMTQMRGFTPHDLAFWLANFSVRTWTFAVPFVGLGMAVSQLTDSTGWARTMAVMGTGASWILFGCLLAYRSGAGAWLLPLMPHSWIDLLWTPRWPMAALIFAAIGLCTTLIGFIRFARRDL